MATRQAPSHKALRRGTALKRYSFSCTTCSLNSTLLDLRSVRQLALSLACSRGRSRLMLRLLRSYDCCILRLGQLEPRACVVAHWLTAWYNLLVLMQIIPAHKPVPHPRHRLCALLQVSLATSLYAMRKHTYTLADSPARFVWLAVHSNFALSRSVCFRCIIANTAGLGLAHQCLLMLR